MPKGGTTRAGFPGRVCLLGEHCDWAGGASLASPLPRSLRADALEHGSEGVRVESLLEGDRVVGDWPTAGRVHPEGGPLRFVGAALVALGEAGVVVPPVHLRVHGDLPAGRGFSSSAAFTLTVLEALGRAGGRVFEWPELAGLAYRVERELLGVECGLLDPLVCAARSTLLIRWDAAVPGGHTYDPVPLSRPVHLLVGAFSRPRDTRGILAVLNRDWHARAPDTIEAFRVFGQAALEGAEALETGNADELGRLMNLAQATYEARLAARLPALEAPGLAAACSWLRDVGALGAKFSGAGGDGSLVAVFDEAAAAAEIVEPLRILHEIRAEVVSLEPDG